MSLFPESNPSYTVTIRSCTVDGGSKTSDTELIQTGSRVSGGSCGQITLTNGTLNGTIKEDREAFDDDSKRLIACIDICRSSHGCNRSSNLNGFNWAYYTPFLLLLNLA